MIRDEDDLMVPRVVARLFRVDPKTLARWAQSGRIPCVVLPSGHRRYRRADIEAILKGDGADEQLRIVRGQQPRRERRQRRLLGRAVAVVVRRVPDPGPGRLMRRVRLVVRAVVLRPWWCDGPPWPQG